MGAVRFDEEFDVVVLGVGAAGAAAALSAHAAGARVVVLDKADPAAAGGNTRVSGAGWFINRDPERAAVFLRSLCGPYPVADDVVEAWARETALNSTWLRSLGAEVGASAQYHTEAEYLGLDGSDCYGGMDTVGARMGNFLLYDFLLGALTERGIEVRFNTPAVELITEDEAVAGVRTGDGRRLRAHGGVVLATGGFAANPRMVRDYLGLTGAPIWGSPHSTGDGHRMAQRLGADLWHMGNMMTITGVRVDDGPGAFLALWAAHHYLFVGADGRRFVDETAENRHGHIERNGDLELFPLRPFHLIFDERMRTAGPLSPSREVLPVGWKLLMENFGWSADNSAEIERGLIRRADSIAELAGLIGVDPATLERTVARYNKACEYGRDDSFGRDPRTLAPVSQPPFYVLEVAPLLGWSNGGPRRDGRARVLDVAGAAIAGLYAAGEVSSTYSWAKDGGFHIADALAFGRVAGREAAARADVAPARQLGARSVEPTVT
ncbi:FAD-dependent oxidoreductase [Nocardia cyriacigeorgica]|uniref:FAD-dependent oxidoreductase n=1 Tax=Nocardia cyriacigeorgica TaxID=135487 RepID=UPI0018947B98|nr:FAD-dependent oxidoreductase [Nocardia cyriacigeorgica]MBF6097141.1 FAD-dependent oxidoreductase [Nocardia cyriacigeorgica]MBF6158615.1 FAD-dependent oxidoreductase [Nocardia cyriacigeorgica]MBF6197697.1 FAD-dependent oxidoreductase [Nocardia cyriacigeorgica]MBF6316562.1 FAD-dependent oxidoreductase [Nocardia cyriacigeorgica]MBF6517244.1 FAD-dependent oxidoreductase [Nocardia cyriacigeorgica]